MLKKNRSDFNSSDSYGTVTWFSLYHNMEFLLAICNQQSLKVRPCLLGLWRAGISVCCPSVMTGFYTPQWPDSTPVLVINCCLNRMFIYRPRIFSCFVWLLDTFVEQSIFPWFIYTLVLSPIRKWGKEGRRENEVLRLAQTCKVSVVKYLVLLQCLLMFAVQLG